MHVKSSGSTSEHIIMAHGFMASAGKCVLRLLYFIKTHKGVTDFLLYSGKRGHIAYVVEANPHRVNMVFVARNSCSAKANAPVTFNQVNIQPK